MWDTEQGGIPSSYQKEDTTSPAFTYQNHNQQPKKWPYLSPAALQLKKKAEKKDGIIISKGGSGEPRRRTSRQGAFWQCVRPPCQTLIDDRFTIRFIKQELKKQGIDTTIHYDFRDWDEIRAWTLNLSHI